MSSLINLATATLLAVSPILSEPKLAERPENVLYEKVEYLENNYVISSYIISEETANVFLVNIKNGNIIDFTYNIGISEDSLFTDGILQGGNPGDSSFEIIYRLPTETEYLDYSETNQFLIMVRYSASSDQLTFNSDFIDLVGSDYVFDNGPMSLSLDLSNSDLPITTKENLGLSYNLKENNLFNMFMDRYFFKIKGSGIIDNTFGVVGNTIQEYVSVVVDLFSQVVALFYAEGKLTILGVLMVFAFGIGVVKFGFNMMKTLLRL